MHSCVYEWYTVFTHKNVEVETNKIQLLVQVINFGRSSGDREHSNTKINKGSFTFSIGKKMIIFTNFYASFYYWLKFTIVIRTLV
jgi:hypothetical protein